MVEGSVYHLHELMKLPAMCLLLSCMKKQFKGMMYPRLREVTWLKYFHQISPTGKKWNNMFLLLKNEEKLFLDTVPSLLPILQVRWPGQLTQTRKLTLHEAPPSSRPLSIPSECPEEGHRRREWETHNTLQLTPDLNVIDVGPES